MNKRLALPGCVLWIAGVIASIVGMNMDSKAGQLTALIGNVLFFIGLGLVGAAWLMMKRKKEKIDREE